MSKGTYPLKMPLSVKQAAARLGFGTGGGFAIRKRDS